MMREKVSAERAHLRFENISFAAENARSDSEEEQGMVRYLKAIWKTRGNLFPNDSQYSRTDGVC